MLLSTKPQRVLGHTGEYSYVDLVFVIWHFILWMWRAAAWLNVSEQFVALPLQLQQVIITSFFLLTVKILIFMTFASGLIQEPAMDMHIL